MKFFLPEIGTEITLAKPWTFLFYKEDRNIDLFNSLGEAEVGKLPRTPIGVPYREYDAHYSGPLATTVPALTLPIGTVLRIDRVYIRQGAKDFSSVTFNIVSTPDPRLGHIKKKRTGRFWAKLEDVNQAEFSLNHDAAKSATTKTVEVRGQPMTFGEFKRELRKRKYNKFWVKFEVGGKVVHDNIVSGVFKEKPRWDSKRNISVEPKYFTRWLAPCDNKFPDITPIPVDIGLENQDKMENRLIPSVEISRLPWDDKPMQLPAGHITIFHITKQEVDMADTAV